MKITRKVKNNPKRFLGSVGSQVLPRGIWAMFRKPQPHTTCRKSTAVHLQFVRQCTPHFYRHAFLASKLLRKGNPAIRPPICTAVCLPFVRQYAFRLYGSPFGKILGVGITRTFLSIAMSRRALWVCVLFQAVKAHIFDGCSLGSPPGKARMPLSENGLESFWVPLRRLSEYGFVAYFINNSHMGSFGKGSLQNTFRRISKMSALFPGKFRTLSWRNKPHFCKDAQVSAKLSAKNLSLTTP